MTPEHEELVRQARAVSIEYGSEVLFAALVHQMVELQLEMRADAVAGGDRNSVPTRTQLFDWAHEYFVHEFTESIDTPRITSSEDDPMKSAFIEVADMLYTNTHPTLQIQIR